MINKKRSAYSLIVLAASLCLASLPKAASSCELAIIWRADMSSRAKTSSAAAAIQFDFVHPGATVRIDPKNLRDIRSVELHVARSYTDHSGPTVVQLYTAADGQMPSGFTRRVTEADLQRQSRPKIAAFSDLVQAVLDHRAYVTVTTKDHPQGELSGFITMHKEEIYSSDPTDISHDPALHRAAS